MTAPVPVESRPAWREPAVAALRAAVARTDGSPEDLLRDLLDDAVAHLDHVLATRPPQTVAALAVPVAVFGALRADPGTGAVPHLAADPYLGADVAPLPPPGLLAAAGATYLALDALDDQMDGEPPAFWADRRPGDAVLGAQVLLLTAAREVGRDAPSARAEQLRRVYRAMLTRVIEGQLRTEEPLSPATTPASVDATIGARSGTMLAGFAQLAAIVAEADPTRVESARGLGYQLGLARQHVNDLTELLGDRTADLRNRTATMAPALALQAGPPGRRAGLVEELRLAADDPALRRRLVATELAPSIADVVVLVQLHLEQARRHAARLCGAGGRHDELDGLIQFTADTVRSHHVP